MTFSRKSFSKLYKAKNSRKKIKKRSIKLLGRARYVSSA